MNTVNCQQRSQEWYDVRRARITGSLIPHIIKNPQQAMVSFVKEALGHTPDFQGNEATRYGTEAEPTARHWYTTYSGCPVEEIGFVIDGEDPRFGCSPDGLVESTNGPVVLEIKCPFSKEIPVLSPEPDHVKQCQWNMAVMGLESCDLVYWAPEQQRIFHLPLDKVLVKDMRDAAVRFLAEAAVILEGDTDAWLAEHGGRKEPRQDPAWARAALEYRLALEANRETDKRLSDAKARLLEMSDGEDCRGGGIQVTWAVRRGSVDWDKLAAAHAIPRDEIESYRKPDGEPYGTVRLAK